MPLSKYTNYHSLIALVDHIYAVTDKNLCREPKAIKNDRSRRDVKKNCVFHKDLGHNTERCVALKDEIERLIRVRYFKEFLDDEPQVANRNERLRQRSPEKLGEVLTIIVGLHVARDSRSTRDRYAKEAWNPSQPYVNQTD